MVSSMGISDPIDVVVRELAIRFGRELRLAAMGLPQREIARRAGISQAYLSRIMRGLAMPDLALMTRLSHAAGHRFWFKLFPTTGVTLRDSGQLDLAEIVRAAAAPIWRIRLEVAVAGAPDLRAADMVLDGEHEVDLLEIERGLFDFQAQLRAAKRKRLALAVQLGRPVILIIGVPDTPSARRKLASHSALILTELPVSSRRAWGAIRSGEPVGGDALLWIRSR
jgi:transcriptional regulator with XRE-family HTH domain